MSVAETILAVVEKIEPGSVIFLQGEFLEHVDPSSWSAITDDITRAAGHDRYTILLLTADAGVKVMHGDQAFDALVDAVARKLEPVQSRTFGGGWQGSTG